MSWDEAFSVWYEEWSARVTDAYRALALREGNTLTWFWIGTHEGYERLLKA